MKKMKRLVGLGVLLALGSAGCTLLTSFDPDGQPCDMSAAPANQCLVGYGCVAGKCKKGAVTETPDAG